jgi:hypothetical protein
MPVSVPYPNTICEYQAQYSLQERLVSPPLHICNPSNPARSKLRDHAPSHNIERNPPWNSNTSDSCSLLMDGDEGETLMVSTFYE